MFFEGVKNAARPGEIGKEDDVDDELPPLVVAVEPVVLLDEGVVPGNTCGLDDPLHAPAKSVRPAAMHNAFTYRFPTRRSVFAALRANVALACGLAMLV